MARQVDAKYGAAEGTIGGLDVARVRIDDLLHDRETQSYAAFTLEEERVEDARPLAGIDAGPVVCDFDDQAGAVIARADFDASAIVQDLEAIQKQVEDDLGHLLLVAFDAGIRR